LIGDPKIMPCGGPRNEICRFLRKMGFIAAGWQGLSAPVFVTIVTG
jgi:hypothetical protein